MDFYFKKFRITKKLVTNSLIELESKYIIFN